MGNSHSAMDPSDVQLSYCNGTTTAANHVSLCSAIASESSVGLRGASIWNSMLAARTSREVSESSEEAARASSFRTAHPDLASIFGRQVVSAVSATPTASVDHFTHDRVITVTKTTLETVVARSAISEPGLSAEKTSTSSASNIPGAFPFETSISGLPSLGKVEAALMTSVSKSLETLETTEKTGTATTVSKSLMKSSTEHSSSTKHSSSTSHEFSTSKSTLYQTSYLTITVTPAKTTSLSVNAVKPSVYDSLPIPGMRDWSSSLVPAQASEHSTTSKLGDSAGTLTSDTMTPTKHLTASAKPTVASAHPHEILPLEELWKHMDKHTVYAAYFIPLEVNASDAVFAHLQGLPKVTLGHGSGPKAANMTGSRSHHGTATHTRTATHTHTETRTHTHTVTSLKAASSAPVMSIASSTTLVETVYPSWNGTSLTSLISNDVSSMLEQATAVADDSAAATTAASGSVPTLPLV